MVAVGTSLVLCLSEQAILALNLISFLFDCSCAGERRISTEVWYDKIVVSSMGNRLLVDITAPTRIISSNSTKKKKRLSKRYAKPLWVSHPSYMSVFRCKRISSDPDQCRKYKRERVIEDRKWELHIIVANQGSFLRESWKHIYMTEAWGKSYNPLYQIICSDNCKIILSGEIRWAKVRYGFSGLQTRYFASKRWDDYAFTIAGPETVMQV